MLDSYLNKSLEYLRSGAAGDNNSFQYLHLSTIDMNGRPRSRTIVLREVRENDDFIIFTDDRTTKVVELKQNPEVHLIGYDHQQLTQLRIHARAEIISDPSERNQLFEQVTDKRIKDYTVDPAPGTRIDDPSELTYLDDEEHHFCPLRLVPYELEYLELKRPNHLRALFKKQDGRWKGEWIAP